MSKKNVNRFLTRQRYTVAVEGGRRKAWSNADMVTPEAVFAKDIVAYVRRFEQLNHLKPTV